jgi:folate-binding protein YgfZ
MDRPEPHSERRTPNFVECLELHDASWGAHRGARIVEHYGSPGEEYRHIRGGAIGLVDRSERQTLVLTGEDAVPWLQGLVTSDLFELVEEGSGQLTHFVNNLGRILSDARLLHVPGLLLADLEPGTLDADGLLGHLRRYIVTEDVGLDDRSAHATHLGLFGRGSAELLAELAEPGHDLGTRESYQGSWGQIAGQDVIIQKIPLAGIEGFDVLCDRDAAHFLWREFGDGERVRPVGHRALEIMRLEAGVPRYGLETDKSIIPVEADLNQSVSYTKGCFVGQEIIHRLDTRGTPAKMLRSLQLAGGEPPALEATVRAIDSDKKVGSIVASAHSPGLDGPIAWSYLKRGHYEVGQTVRVDIGEEWREARVEPLGGALDRVSAASQ